MNENHLLLKVGEGDGIELTLFSFHNRKQVRFPVELKSTKIIIQEGTHLSYSNTISSLTIFKTQTLHLMKIVLKQGLLKERLVNISAGH